MRTEKIVRSVSGWFVTRRVLRHLVSVDGLRHLPTEGSFVVAPNRASYFDHFVMEILIRAALGRPVWFLTKRESFVKKVSRVWTVAWYGIPVDRDAPSPDTLRAVRAVLSSGDVLCVYPEGTRNTGLDMLPFQAGAFRFALAADVPIIPVALSGTADVLRRGDRWFRRGGKVHVSFGTPLSRDVSVSKQSAAVALADATRRSIQQLLDAGDQRESDPSGARSFEAAAHLDQLITRSLDADGRLSPHSGRRLRLLADLLSPMDRVPHHVEAQRARLKGLAALRLPNLLRIIPAFGVRRTLHQILAHDPEHGHANYLLGRWHLAMPNALGGRPREAVAAFSRSAAALPENTRALVGLADAHFACNDSARAIATMQLLVNGSVRPGTRDSERVEKARLRLVELARKS